MGNAATSKKGDSAENGKPGTPTLMYKWHHGLT